MGAPTELPALTEPTPRAGEWIREVHLTDWNAWEPWSEGRKAWHVATGDLVWWGSLFGLQVLGRCGHALTIECRREGLLDRRLERADVAPGKGACRTCLRLT